MTHKLTFLLIITALLLAACSRATPNAPQATLVGNPTAYPSPEQELSPQPDTSNPAYPYSYPQPYTDPFMGDDLTIIELKPGINTDLAPQEGDQKLVKGPAYVEVAVSKALAAAGDQPAALHLVGNVPNPCFQLRVIVHEPDAQNKLMVEVYSVADPEKVCAEMLQPFDESISLNTLAAGSYTVYINEEELGKIKVK
jgi:hypothetical protein